MSRPPTLKPSLHTFIQDSLRGLSLLEVEDLMRKCGYQIDADHTLKSFTDQILDRPTAFLYRHCDLCHKPELLKDSFIQFEDDLPDGNIDYYIDETAAKLISQNAAMVILTRIQDGELFGVPVKRIISALKKGCFLDYMEEKVLHEKDIQHIIDHFHVGRLELFYSQEGFYKIKTNQGQFLLFEWERFERGVPGEVRKVESVHLKLEQLLLPDYKGNLEKRSSYVYRQGKYYSLFRIIGD